MSVIIDGFVIDAARNEEHEFASEVTEHPVEEGADIADHVRRQPNNVTIEGVVSDTPIGEVAGLRDEGALPSDQAFALLQEIADSRRPVTVETSLQVFDNMILSSLNVPRDARTGDSFQFTAQFVQIALVTNQRTTIETASPRGRNKVNRGNKPSRTARLSLLGTPQLFPEVLGSTAPPPDANAQDNVSVLGTPQLFPGVL